MNSFLRPSTLLLALLLAGCAAPSAPPASVTINLVALNDFHGNLESSTLSIASLDQPAKHSLQAGGIDNIAAALQAWRRDDPQLLFIGAGDLVGASPSLSAMWADEPTLHAMGMLGMRLSSVGNHEFDQGRVELLRQQRGGCASPRPDKACQYTPAFEGAQFAYLAANAIDRASGQSILPGYRIETVRGVKIAFLGAVYKEVSTAVPAAGIATIDFIDPADAINALLPSLRAQGVGVFVAVIHRGGETDEPFDQPDCARLDGPIVSIVQRLDPAIGMVISGDSHKPYTCRIGGRLVTQSDMGGHMLTRIALKVQPGTADVPDRLLDASANNVIMRAGAFPPEPAMQAYLAAVKERGGTFLSRPVAALALASVSREINSHGESPLGDLVADSMLDATRPMGAQIAFMNKGGMRADLEAGAGLVTTFGQTQVVLPFGNNLILVSFTGAQLKALLEQQWPNERGLLQVSAGFSYRWDSTLPDGAHVLPGSMTLDGKPVDLAARYRVVTNNFLAGGGDNFTLFAGVGQHTDTGLRDADALRSYLAARAQHGQPAGTAEAAERIRRVR